jgi:hypothetical protein
MSEYNQNRGAAGILSGGLLSPLRQPFRFFLCEPQGYPPNHNDAGRNARPIAPEFLSCDRVGRLRSSLHEEDRTVATDGIGAQCPHDLSHIQVPESW